MAANSLSASPYFELDDFCPERIPEIGCGIEQQRLLHHGGFSTSTCRAVGGAGHRDTSRNRFQSGMLRATGNFGGRMGALCNAIRAHEAPGKNCRTATTFKAMISLISLTKTEQESFFALNLALSQFFSGVARSSLSGEFPSDHPAECRQANHLQCESHPLLISRAWRRHVEQLEDITADHERNDDGNCTGVVSF